MDISSENKEVKTFSDESKQGKRDLTIALIVCILVVITVRSFLFEPFKIPSSSMVPTLKIGDHIFVSKFSFGLSIPFTKSEFLKLGTPKHGDVIVFLYPNDESLYYIKRVVGLPGDRILIRGRDVFLNDKLISKEKVKEEDFKSLQIDRPGENDEYFRENLDGNVHLIRHSQNNLYKTITIERVPDDSFFVMGDNRDDSYDSRSWGFVPRQNVKGKAQVIWLSLDQDGDWKNFQKIRWNRCGLGIY